MPAYKQVVSKTIKCLPLKLMAVVLKHQLLIAPAIFLLIPYNTVAQTISGTVLSAQTKESVPYANIYFNNSFNGSVSDIDGNRVAGVVITGSILDPNVVIRGYGSVKDNEPLYLMDGFPVSKEAILNTPLVMVESVDILKGTAAAVFGARGGNGAIALNTKTGITAKSKRRTGVTNLTNVGYYVSREFFSPDYSIEKEAHAKPDFRSTLYWNPEVVIDSTGTAEVSFYNADYLTNYMVEIEGITTEGVPLRATTQFDSE